MKDVIVGTGMMRATTGYGIGSVLTRIVSVVLDNQRSVMTICTPATAVFGVRNVTVSLPRLLGGEGALESFPLPLTADETTQLRNSAQIIRSALDDLKIDP